jgi:hypothetical protein
MAFAAVGTENHFCGGCLVCYFRSRNFVLVSTLCIILSCFSLYAREGWHGLRGNEGTRKERIEGFIDRECKACCSDIRETSVEKKSLEWLLLFCLFSTLS